jgi:hypothetical protein
MVELSLDIIEWTEQRKVGLLGGIKLGGDPGAAPAEREGFEKQIG